MRHFSWTRERGHDTR